MHLRVFNVPQKFLLKDSCEYPPHQMGNPMIEERALEYFTNPKNTASIETELVYLPIQWTAYHGSHHYGQYTADLQIYYREIISQIPNAKFFTIVQWDGGALVELPNCTVFSCSPAQGDNWAPIPDVDGWKQTGDKGEYVPIPVLCDPHPVTKITDPKYKASFVGRRTDGIRDKMFQELEDVEGFCLKRHNSAGLENSTHAFRSLMDDSIFALCPRGYGPTSFRFYEAIQMGRIPIYISDTFWLPFQEFVDWERAALLISPEEIHTIPERIDELLQSEKYYDYLSYGRQLYERHTSWEGCLETIGKLVQRSTQTNVTQGIKT